MEKTVDFYYVRHGKTLFNELGRMQGYCDSPLTERGIEIAKEAREELKDIDFDKAYCSTSERCVDTASIVLEGRDIPIIYTKGLKEMNFGTYEGTRIKNHLQEIDERRFSSFDWSDVIFHFSSRRICITVCLRFRRVFFSSMASSAVMGMCRMGK